MSDAKRIVFDFKNQLLAAKMEMQITLQNAVFG